MYLNAKIVRKFVVFLSDNPRYQNLICLECGKMARSSSFIKKKCYFAKNILQNVKNIEVSSLLEGPWDRNIMGSA